MSLFTSLWSWITSGFLRWRNSNDHAGRGRHRMTTLRFAAGNGMLTIEDLEPRYVLSATATLLGKEVPIPHWVPEEKYDEVRDAFAAVTLTNSTEMVHATMAESRDVIEMDAFEPDPQYAGVEGSGYSIAVLDSGADLDHPYFGPNEDANPAIADRIVWQWDYVNDDCDPNDNSIPCADDDNGHGTHVASIAAGFQEDVFAGVATGANIIVLKVLDENLNGSFSDVEQAILWVMENADLFNIAAVNMSLGDGGNYDTAQQLGGISDDIQALKMIDVTVVSAAGNCFYEFGSAQGVAYPAADINSLAISATWDANEGGPFSWSGSGCDASQPGSATDNTTDVDRLTSFSQRDEELTDAVAPGALTTAAWLDAGTNTISGTSMAAPHVAGMAVLAQQLSMQKTSMRIPLDDDAETGRTGMRTHLAESGAFAFDGEVNHDDNVVNTEALFDRADMFELADEIVAPTVTAITISGTTSAHADYAFPTGSGDQIRTVPVGAADTVSVTFSEEVQINFGVMGIYGRYTGETYAPADADFSYDPATFTASWTWDVFPADQLEIVIPDINIKDTAGNILDGEWTNPTSLTDANTSTFPSGDGFAGGDFHFYVTILPGNGQRDNFIEQGDRDLYLRNWDMFPAVWTDGDTSGDAHVHEEDQDQVEANLGTDFRTWPAGGAGGGTLLTTEQRRQMFLDSLDIALAEIGVEDFPVDTSLASADEATWEAFKDDLVSALDEHYGVSSA